MSAEGQSSKTRRKPAPAILILALLCAALPCRGAARLEASLGFGGYSAPGRWVPLWLRCEGLPPSASLRVLRLSAEGRSLGAETFPVLEGIRLECPIWMDGELGTISVRLLSGDRTLAEVKLEARSKLFPGHIVIACGLSKDARLAIASALLPIEPVLVIPTSGSELPSNGLDYDAVSAIAIADPELELTRAQRTAILAWTAGGGRLCLAESPGGQSSIPGLSGLPGGSSGAGGQSIKGSVVGSVPYGLGNYAFLSSDRAEAPQSWIEALSLEPYGQSLRTGAGTLARGSEAAGKEPGVSSALRTLITAAIAAWLAAIFLAATFSRARVAPIAVVSGLFLAAVLAGGPALDRAFARGASLRALSLVLPESGSSFLSIRARAYASPASLDWASARAIGSPALAYSGTESGSFGEWRHSLAMAAFGIRSTNGRGIDLEGLLSPEEWGRISLGSTSAFPSSGAGLLRGGTEPPEVDSSYPLAFLASGEPAAWWAKEPGARWAKLEAAPVWLVGDAQRLLALRGERTELSLLAGSCPADRLALSLEGGKLSEITWAMPLPKGGAR
jgi:hypothetical protein